MAFVFATESNLAILIVVLATITAVAGLATFVQVAKCRAENMRLREGLHRLSDDVKQLMIAEQRRFLMELKSSKEEGALTANDRPPPES